MIDLVQGSDWIWSGLALLVAAGLWIGLWGLHRMGLVNRRWAALVGTMRLVCACLFWTSLLGVIASLWESANTWSHGFIALSAAIASEVVLCCYLGAGRRRDRRLATELASIALAWLRVGLIGLLAWLLLEPVITHEQTHEQQRWVAVLLDDSDSMALPSRSLSDGGASRTQVARRLLSGEHMADGGMLQRLSSDYQVRLYRFGSDAQAIPDEEWSRPGYFGPSVGLSQVALASSNRSQSTDFVAALDRVKQELPVSDLSGIIWLTDGCDHSSGNLQQACGQLIEQRMPINSVVIGSQQAVRDAEITTVQAAAQIFQGDSWAVRVSVRVDDCAGQSSTVRLLKSGQVVDERPLKVTSPRHRETILLTDQPDVLGIQDYTIELEAFPDEQTLDNNRVQQSVSVSQDRIHLLLIDDRPRWEYRYLRNLLSGRDTTVYLQAVMLRPDRLAGVPDPTAMPASALRAFDDCEATALPTSLEEWLKFDVIVLGDVPLELLGDEGLKALDRFVAGRGGTLIVISGQHYMPHTYAQTALADLLPVRLDRPQALSGRSPDDSFFFSPAVDAGSQSLLQTVDSNLSSLAAKFPELSWRHPASHAKSGASVLAHATPQRPRAAHIDQPGLSDTGPTPEREQALLLWHRVGAGRVLQMTFDQSWRLRYGTGDKHHHQYWGQIVRWAASERLPAGTEWVRLGTDRVMYRSGDTIHVRARLVDQQRNPIIDQPVQAIIYRDEEVIQQLMLTPHTDNYGLLQGELRGLDQPGRYRLELGGPTVQRLLLQEGHIGTKVATEVYMQAHNQAIEHSDIVADTTVPVQMANWSGGQVVTPENITQLYDTLGPGSLFHRERWTVPLWNLWPVLLCFLGGLCVEWIVRKRHGWI